MSDDLGVEPVLICLTCGTEFAPAAAPRETCPICIDERQYVKPDGQRWTTLVELQSSGRRMRLTEVEPGLHRLTTEPSVAIGQQPMIISTEAGNLMFDVPAYLDPAGVEAVRGIGGLAAIAPSHPHHFGSQVEWSRAFGDVPVWVNRHDVGWVQRHDPVIRTWEDEAQPLPGLTLHRIGGHFPGSCVALWPAGADGRGVLLSGDGIAPVAAAGWVTFLRSYPNQIPLSAAVVRRIAATVGKLTFDRHYDEFARVVEQDAAGAIRRSAERYAAWVSGENDHLTI